MSHPLSEVLEGLPLAPGVRVLQTHASGLVAFEKPCGLRSHPNRPGLDRGALLLASYDAENESYQWSQSDGETGSFYLLNRIDAPASGIILGTTDEYFSIQLKELFTKRGVKKRYNALVKDHVGKGARIWRDRLQFDRTGGRIKVQASKTSGMIAETVLLKVQKGRNPQQCSLLELEPRTGRTHQLRVQCAARGFPMVGDGTYGDFRFNRAWARNTGSKRLFLHSSQIAFDFSWKGRNISFEVKSALPKEFMELLNFSPPV